MSQNSVTGIDEEDLNVGADLESSKVRKFHSTPSFAEKRPFPLQRH